MVYPFIVFAFIIFDHGRDSQSSVVFGRRGAGVAFKILIEVIKAVIHHLICRILYVYAAFQ